MLLPTKPLGYEVISWMKGKIISVPYTLLEITWGNLGDKLVRQLLLNTSSAPHRLLGDVLCSQDRQLLVGRKEYFSIKNLLCTKDGAQCFLGILLNLYISLRIIIPRETEAEESGCKPRFTWLNSLQSFLHTMLPWRVVVIYYIFPRSF